MWAYASLPLVSAVLMFCGVESVSAALSVSRCLKVVEKFLSLDLDDPSVDLQLYMKKELLPSVGELL